MIKKLIGDMLGSNSELDKNYDLILKSIVDAIVERNTKLRGELKDSSVNEPVFNTGNIINGIRDFSTSDKRICLVFNNIDYNPLVYNDKLIDLDIIVQQIRVIIDYSLNSFCGAIIGEATESKKEILKIFMEAYENLDKDIVGNLHNFLMTLDEWDDTDAHGAAERYVNRYKNFQNLYLNYIGKDVLNELNKEGYIIYGNANKLINIDLTAFHDPILKGIQNLIWSGEDHNKVLYEFRTKKDPIYREIVNSLQEAQYYIIETELVKDLGLADLIYRKALIDGSNELDGLIDIEYSLIPILGSKKDLFKEVLKISAGLIDKDVIEEITSLVEKLGDDDELEMEEISDSHIYLVFKVLAQEFATWFINNITDPFEIRAERAELQLGIDFNKSVLGPINTHIDNNILVEDIKEKEFNYDIDKRAYVLFSTEFIKTKSIDASIKKVNKEIPNYFDKDVKGVSDILFKYSGARMIPGADEMIIFCSERYKVKTTNNGERTLTYLDKKIAEENAEKEAKIIKSKLRNLEENVNSMVIGQENAISGICKVIRKRFVLGSKNKPVGSFLCCGPTGVGKTETAKALSKHLFNNLIHLNLSEYQSEIDVSKLIGVASGYAGYNDGGVLTNAVKKNPRSVVLFDEIEKAHPNIYDVLLQILDEGVVADNKGEIVSFENCLIILTSNVMIDQFADTRAAIMSSLKNHFKIELIGRFDEVFKYNTIDGEDIKKIIDLKYSDIIEDLNEKNIHIDISNKSKEILFNKLNHEVKKTNSELGVREIKRLLSDIFEDVFEEIVEDELKSEKDFQDEYYYELVVDSESHRFEKRKENA